MNCPYCNSNNIRKGGHLKSGAQRYICKSCKKNFSEVTKVKEPIPVDFCPNCGKTKIVRCGFDNGKQRYRCNSCNYKFIEGSRQKPSHERYNVECPHCKHQYAKKSGKDRGDRQFYKCLACGHRFIENAKYRHLTTKQKKFIITYNLNLGVDKKQIAEHLNINYKTVYNVIRRFKNKIGADDGRKRKD